VGPLSLIKTWPVPTAAAAIIDGDGSVETRGPLQHSFRLASITKILTAWAALVAVEEGSLALDTPIGQSGCTLRHLLCHAGGYPFDGPSPIAAPGRRRIYSNTGYELVAAAITEATGFEFGDYLREAVFEPLRLNNTELRGSPAHGIWSTLDDMTRFAAELMRPTLLADETANEATSPQFPDLGGVIPGLGIYQPCPWGLGPEIRGDKEPHWTGRANSPQTFGHFGGAGTMLWIDPAHDVALVALTDRDFDSWAPDALRLWPELSDAVLASRGAD